jgi:oligopeptidase A
MLPAEKGHALLSHREVVRLFHELGYIFHHPLSEVPIRALAGTHVAWDFVEFPSILFECLTWEPVVLDQIGRHVDTDEPIPVAVRDQMLNCAAFVRSARSRGSWALLRSTCICTR